MHYNYFRTYDPVIGRYITSDPVGLGGGSNTYLYTGGNPITWLDVLGLDRITFDGSNVIIIHTTATRRGQKETGRTIFAANSGRGIGLNDPSQQSVPDTGPIPEGRYSIDLSDDCGCPDKSVNDGDSVGWGLYGWRLNESVPTTINRRLFSERTGGFFLHQDEFRGNATGTAGCIGVTGNKNITAIYDFLEKYSKNHDSISVAVSYD